MNTARLSPRPLPSAGVAVLVVAAAGLALLPLPYNLAAAVGLGTIALTLLRPLWGLYLVMLSVPIQDVGAVRFSGAAITATKVLVPLAIVTWLVLRLTRGDARLARSWLLLPYGLYVVVLTGSTIAAVDQATALTEAIRWIQAFGVFLMTLDLVRTRRDLAGLVTMLLLGGLFQAGVGLTQSVIGAGPASFAVAAGFSRAFGTFGMPNSYAGYLEMTFPLALGLGVWLLRVPSTEYRVPSTEFRTARPALAASLGTQYSALSTQHSALGTRYLVLGTSLWALVLLLLAAIGASFSRGAWLGTAVGVATMIALAGRRSLAIGATVAIVAGSMLALGGASLLPAGLTDRVTTIGDSLGYRDVRRMVITPENWAVAERLAMWEAGLAMFRARPIYGVGAGNFNVAYDRYRVPQFVFSRGHAHNYYIHVAAEAGMIGLAAYALVLIGAWADIGRALRRLRDGWLRTLVVGAAGILAAVTVHHLVENLHVLNMNLHLFAVLALPALALRVPSSESRVPSVEN